MIVRYLIGIGIGACIGAAMGYYGKCSSGTCPLTANPYRGAIYGSILGLVFAAMSGGQVKNTSEDIVVSEKGTAQEQPTNTSGLDDQAADEETEQVAKEHRKEALIHIENAEDFKKYVLGASKPCLADFYSNRCPPCKMLAPVVEQLATKYAGKAAICKVSLDAAPELAAPYRITGIPAVLFFENGEEVYRLIGLRSQPDYEKVLDNMLKK